jgi:hypothetical protein
MQDEFAEFVANLEPKYANAAVYMFTFNAKAHGGATLKEAHAAAAQAFEDSVWGANCPKDSKGNYVPQGVGSRGRENGNHLRSILKYEGPAAYEKELRRIWKDTPDHARKIGLPEPARAGA